MKMNIQFFAESGETGVVGRWQHPGYLDVSKDLSENFMSFLGFGVTQFGRFSICTDIFQKIC